MAILKAGGGYMPLDPRHPPERLRLLLEDAGPVVVLAAANTALGTPAATGAHVVLIEELGATLAGLPDVSPGHRAFAETTPYLIHTSGSTGQPKGVVISHSGICNRLLWMQDQYGLGPEDRVLQKTPYTFDVSVWEFFWPLISGACLVMARPEVEPNAVGVSAR